MDFMSTGERKGFHLSVKDGSKILPDTDSSLVEKTDQGREEATRTYPSIPAVKNTTQMWPRSRVRVKISMPTNDMI